MNQIYSFQSPSYSYISYTLTQRRGRVINTPASYLGGPGFKCRPLRPAILTDVLRGLSQ
jgi:hypothetical protein